MLLPLLAASTLGASAAPAPPTTSFRLSLANLEYSHERFSVVPPPEAGNVPAFRPNFWYGTAPFTVSPDSGDALVRQVTFLVQYEGGRAVAAWVDVDADGDLVEETPAALNDYTPTPGARSSFLRLALPAAPSATAPAPPGAPDPMLARAVFDPAPADGSRPSYRLQRVYAPAGEVVMNGAPRLAVLWDGNVDGRFTEAYGDGIFVDLDGDKRIDVDPMSLEFGPFAVPFTLGDRQYRATPVGSDGTAVRWSDLGAAARRVVAAPGERAPAIVLRDEDGRDLARADWKGRPVLLHFWASWCGTCSSQMPGLLELYADAHERGLQIVGVSFDEERAAFERYVAEHGLPWENAFEGRKFWENAAATAFQVHGAGAMILIAPDGTIDGKYTDVAAVRERVRELLRLGPNDGVRARSGTTTGNWRFR